MNRREKPLVWLHGEVKAPPFTAEGRVEVGFLLRSLQRGENLGMPQSRAMPSIGKRCHELRVGDAGGNWRIVYRVDDDAIVVLEVLKKKTPRTPAGVVDACLARLKEYDDA